jgi:thermitase
LIGDSQAVVVYLHNHSAWSQGAYGDNTIIQITDVDLMAMHEEVADRFIMSLSYNGYTNKLDPTSLYSADNHGTACAGVAAAKSGNDICGQGIAPLASLAGRTIFGTYWSGTPVDFANALYNTKITDDGRQVDINSNRYGRAFHCLLKIPNSHPLWMMC